jgi:4-amino-4-deoxy-L-arabinose transferase-like glycosyltransferase
MGALLKDKRTGLIIAGITAIMPFAVVHSHYLTPQIQFSALTLLALVSGVKIMRQRAGMGQYILFAVWSALSVGTYLFFGIFAFAALLGVSMTIKTKPLLHRRSLAVSLCVMLFLVALTNPCLFLNASGFLARWRHLYAMGNSLSFDFMYPLIRVLPYGMGAWLFGVSLAGLIWASGKKDSATRFLLAWCLIYYAVVVVTGSSHWVRRFAPLQYVMVVWAGIFITDILEKVKNFTLVKIAIVAGGMCVAGATFGYSIALLDLFSRDTRESAYIWIQKNIPSHSRIAIRNWFYVPHLDKNAYRIYEGLAPADLSRGDFEYYILSDIDEDIRAVLSAAPQYSLLKSFSAVPKFCGATFGDILAPHDMRYANPVIYLLHRKAGP